MKEIPLTQGQIALVDDADFEAVSAFRWYAHKNTRTYYATRHIKNERPGGPRQLTISLHSFLLPGVAEIDHMDGNGLNCQRYNLRASSHSKNAQSFQSKRRGTTSSFRGVCRFARDGRWQAQIRVENKLIFLGRFQNEIEAARAYDAAAQKYFGGFASPNFS